MHTSTFFVLRQRISPQLFFIIFTTMSLLDLPNEEPQSDNEGPLVAIEDPLVTLQQEVALLRQLVTTTINPPYPQTSTPAHNRPQSLLDDVVLRPKDVPKLEVEQLQGIEATARLQLFFEQVEQCAQDSASRIRIAKSRVSSEIAILIHNNRSNLLVWSEFKDFLISEFGAEINFDTAWQELTALNYDWLDAPQAFMHKFICKYGAIESRFPSNSLPNRERLLKRRLWKGMPKAARNRLEEFLDEAYPLKQFIERLSHERVLMLESNDNPMLAVKATDTPSTPTTSTNPCVEPTPVSSAANAQDTEMHALRQRVTELEQALNSRTPPPPPLSRPPHSRPPSSRPYLCSYCRAYDHTLQYCTRRPPIGHCFDCRRPGCRRGHPNCPARRPNPPQQNSQSPSTIRNPNHEA